MKKKAFSLIKERGELINEPKPVNNSYSQMRSFN